MVTTIAATTAISKSTPATEPKYYSAEPVITATVYLASIKNPH